LTIHISGIGAEWILEQEVFVAKDPLAELVNTYRTHYRLSDQLEFYAGLDSF
jgi:hypothetical protein